MPEKNFHPQENDTRAFEKFDAILREKTGNSYGDYTSIFPKFDVLQERHLKKFHPQTIAEAFIAEWNLKTPQTSNFTPEQTATFNRQIVALRDFVDEMNPDNAPDNWRALKNGSIVRQIEPEKSIMIQPGVAKDGSPSYRLSENGKLGFKQAENRNLYEISAPGKFETVEEGPDINAFSYNVLTYQERCKIIDENESKVARPKVDDAVTREINQSARRELGPSSPSL